MLKLVNGIYFKAGHFILSRKCLYFEIISFYKIPLILLTLATLLEFSSTNLGKNKE